MMTVTMATLACLPLPAWCASIEQGNFDIRRASVGQFAGILEVAVTESGQAGVVIEGEDRVLDGFRLQQVDGELQIRAPQVDGAVSVITGDIRGNGEVTINGRRYGPDDPLPEPTRITLTLVRGTALDILDEAKTTYQPTGAVLTKVDDTYAEIDLAAVERARRRIPSLMHDRPFEGP